MSELVVEFARGLSGALPGGTALAPYRGWILFVHLCAAIGWIGPAMGASFLVHVSALERGRDPGNAELIRRDLWVRRHFNQVVALEHVAFALLIVTGLMLGQAGGWLQAEQGWLRWKLVLVFLLFIPMELVDVVLTAWLQRTERRQAAAGAELLPDTVRGVRWQDLFLRATIPPVTIGIPVALYLAVVKPA